MVLIPVEQLDPQFLFQLDQLLIQAGLCDEKGFRCLGNAAVVCNCDHIFQLS